MMSVPQPSGGETPKALYKSQAPSTEPIPELVVRRRGDQVPLKTSVFRKLMAEVVGVPQGLRGQQMPRCHVIFQLVSLLVTLTLNCLKVKSSEKNRIWFWLAGFVLQDTVSCSPDQPRLALILLCSQGWPSTPDFRPLAFRVLVISVHHQA